MTATYNDIKNWLYSGVSQHKKYMIVACDTYDWENYPIYCNTDEECLEKYNYLLTNNNMQKCDEVYDLSMDLKKQLNTERCMNLPNKGELKCV